MEETGCAFRNGFNRAETSESFVDFLDEATTIYKDATKRISSWKPTTDLIKE